jgi:hypothetical protein
MSQNPITKLNAISLICMETGRGRHYVEQKLKAMTEAGLIVMEKSTYTTAILISREDLDKVIATIKAETEAKA